MTHMTPSRTTVTRQNGAYTLVEMMVVMLILIVVMALVAPIIGNARNAAKRTNTQQLLNNLTAGEPAVRDRQPGHAGALHAS